jgi:acetyltransferase-like isoleucine patch superfamily enzyme
MVQLRQTLPSSAGKPWKVIRAITRWRYRRILSGSGAILSRGAVLEGNLRHISVGSGTVVEAGAVLSTAYGGKIVLGHNCVIRRGAMIMTYGGDIELGDSCIVGPYAILYGHGGLRVGAHVLLAAHTIVIPANHTYEELDATIYDQPLSKRGITIEDDVWIGAGTRILDGTLIGTGSVIGAGSVICQNIKPFSVNAGVPSRPIRMRKDSAETKV